MQCIELKEQKPEDSEANIQLGDLDSARAALASATEKLQAPFDQFLAFQYNARLLFSDRLLDCAVGLFGNLLVGG